jgi:hypothetical protein
MNIRRLAASIALTLVLTAPVLAQPERIAPELAPDSRTLRWPADPATAHRLRVTGPDGEQRERSFAAGEPVAFADGWTNGLHHWELLAVVAGSDARIDNGRDSGPARAADPVRTLASGKFLAAGGVVELADAAPGTAYQAGDTDDPARPVSTRDQVIADDLIVQGSICTGFDCVNNENFGFATLKLKENNTRLLFEDTSASGFPARSWQITANDASSGGLDYLGFEDVTAATRPFWVQGGARNNALVATGSRIGIGIAAPTDDIHLADLDTATLRLDQTAGGGFTPQTWDVGGNEANFFIRDVTGGSRLSFRIQPGAPTNTITANASGNVGLGLWAGDAGARLDVYRNTGDQPLLRVRTGALVDGTTQLELGATGNLRVNGTVSQLSSRAAKTNFVPVDLDSVLDRVALLPLTVWNYLHQPEAVRHLGPTAEDFHAAFGLGERPTEIAPGDLAGVALAAVQALNQQVAERDRQIEDLEHRLARLEARLADDAGQR